MSSDRPRSVIEGRDPEVLQHLLDFYARPGANVLDATANARRMWKGVEWAGTKTFMDIDPEMKPDVVGDFQSLPFEDNSFHVIVFDPPHLPLAAASTASMSQMVDNYGLAKSTKADSIAEIFPTFLAEARRVLKDDGLIFTKLKDYVHNHKYQWILADWINAVRAVDGLTPCDMRIKLDPCGGNLSSSLWETCHHARVVHTWWLVTRKGRCEARAK